MSVHHIQLSGDQDHIKQFAAWLTSHGHTVELNCKCGNFIDGRWACNDDHANELMKNLWENFEAEACHVR